MNFKAWIGAAFLFSEAIYYFFGPSTKTAGPPSDITPPVVKRAHVPAIQAAPPIETPRPDIIVAPAQDGSLKQRWR